MFDGGGQQTTVVFGRDFLEKAGQKMNRQSYYYQQMTANEQLAYHIICDGLQRHQADIRILVYPGMMSAADIYYRVLYDYPILFYVNPHSVRHSHQNCEWTIYPEYVYSASEARTIIAEMHQVVDKVIHKALEYKNDPFEMELFLHNSVVKSVVYDYESLKVQNCYSAHSIVGAFLDKKAVCEGISKAFKFLCDLVGLPCILVVGYADAHGVFQKNSLHAWNLVNIGGQWYHVDPTWDAMDLTHCCKAHPEHHFKYDYFNLPTEDILADHRPTDTIPLCTALEGNYFYWTGKYAKNYKDMMRIIERQIDSDRIRIRTDCRKSTEGMREKKKKQPPAEYSKQLILDALQEVQKKRKTCYKYSYYFNERLGIMNLCRM